MPPRIQRLCRALGIACSAALLLVALPASAQTANVCDQPGEEPDVIVGDLFAIGTYGPVGGISAFSVGTFSCNIGSCWLNWFDTSNQHPVISQSMFRLKAGRFEQIGQGWLKHGFFALSEDLCATPETPCIGTDGTHLGVNCADPYSVGLNAQQSNLGPKSDVNASTGAFTYPFPTIGQTGNAIFKRLQVHNTDLLPSSNPGAQYFVEAMYVTADDAAAGNQHNNASYRPVAIVGGNPTFSAGLTGETVRQKAAIQAWRDTDPTVVEGSVVVDGKFIVASKVTDLGNGRWHYEYAVQNLNSHRAAKWLRVPLPAGAAPTNFGFHDVDYHSGEPYDGTDWAHNGGTHEAVLWHTSHEDNANALRWGTLYNFRFDAAAPPVQQSVSLGLFRVGFPIAVPVSVLAPQRCDADGQCETGETCQTCPADCSGPLDSDGDGVADGCDNCDLVANLSQQDLDLDDVGDACDSCPQDPLNDLDGDTFCNMKDNCLEVANDQSDLDEDGLGDPCDPCPLDLENDADGDTLCADDDNCPTLANPAQADSDADGAGDGCDNCPGLANPSQADTDGDGQGNSCDVCPADALNDGDADGVCGNVDNCAQVANPGQGNADGDARGDACDPCPADPLDDRDHDTVCDGADNCVLNPNPDQSNFDGDALGDACDVCSQDPTNDADGDSVCENADNCPGLANANQADGDQGYGSQWGVAAIASSEWSPTAYSAMQATGPPESPLSCIDASFNWCPLEGGTEPEWLEVGYAAPMRARSAIIYESQMGHFVTQIEARDGDGALHTVWSGADPSECGDGFVPEWTMTPYFVTALRIHTAVDSWEEIDAVALLGVSAGGGPASADGVGDACDLCPALYNPEQQPLVFGQSIRAASRSSLVWSQSTDVDFVRGDLASVAAYSVLASGTLPAASALDIQADNPQPQTGFYYLLKLQGDCGSWQSMPDAEPARDTQLP